MHRIITTSISRQFHSVTAILQQVKQSLRYIIQQQSVGYHQVATVVYHLESDCRMSFRIRLLISFRSDCRIAFRIRLSYIIQKHFEQYLYCFKHIQIYTMSDVQVMLTFPHMHERWKTSRIQNYRRSWTFIEFVLNYLHGRYML